jgi:hypothetical protein
LEAVAVKSVAVDRGQHDPGRSKVANDNDAPYSPPRESTSHDGSASRPAGLPAAVDENAMLGFLVRRLFLEVTQPPKLDDAGNAIEDHFSTARLDLLGRMIDAKGKSDKTLGLTPTLLPKQTKPVEGTMEEIRARAHDIDFEAEEVAALEPPNDDTSEAF